MLSKKGEVSYFRFGLSVKRIVCQRNFSLMSRFFLSLTIIFTGYLGASPGRAAENPYDVFAQTIAPYAAFLSSESTTRGLHAELALVSASEVDARFQGIRMGLALQLPDKLRITVDTRDDRASLIRNGQEFLATPAGPAQELLNEVAPGLLAYTGSIQAEIPDFKLPVPRQQLAFLPALFAIDDQGEQAVDGETCRVLDVKLTPALAKGEAGNWSIRMWINAEYRPVLMELRGQKNARVQVAVRSVSLEANLPPETWKVAEGDEALQITPAQILQLIDALRGQMKM